MDSGIDQHILDDAARWWTLLRAPDSNEDTIARWLDWTAADPRHLQAFERINALGGDLGALDTAARGDLLRRFAAPRARWRPLQVAACIGVLALGGVLAWRQLNPPPVTQVYSSAISRHRDIVLADGSKIALGGASRLSTRFSAAQRRVELIAGEAFFDVAHHAGRPFVVDAGGVSILDVGTAFDVSRDGERVEIAVTEGRVRIYGAGQVPADGRGGLEAVAGQRVSYDPARPTLQVGQISVAQAIAWRDHRLEFVDTPLDTVIARVNRYSDRPLRLADPALARLSFTGTVDTRATAQWIEALPQVFPLQVSQGKDEIVLSRR
ncbi:FecR family protein [Xanthomonas indica]|uniref:FecR domain-containing protein n=1 Tax=Xanthomonas indica TaxID=2912242 RepID=A0AAU8I1G6_9XANT|nr:FecR domain-containing protein [Xanthomonas indica]MCI2261942.1 FecR domain-containing protein [Xanthomonas indica]